MQLELMDDKNKIVQSTKDALSKIAPAKVNELKQEIKKTQKKATGKLISSVRSEITSTGTRVDLDIYAEDYAEFIHEGRAKGKFPPVQPIKNWMKVKGIDEDALFPILNKIKNEGIKAVPILDAVTTKGIAEIISSKLSESLEDSLARIIRTQLK